MPRRDDINRILLIGSGPIVIGQACEFDYSGTQGAKALKSEGYEVVLVNSNPATVMTDPEFANKTYVEPLTAATLEQIIDKERPDAVLATLGGQTALNLALELHERKFLQERNIELIGANVAAIRKAEDREEFKVAMEKIGLKCPRAHFVQNLDEAHRAADDIGFPVILRPSFTLGGSGGGIAYNREEFDRAIRWAFQQSPTHSCLVEQSVLGWKEFELEVIRDVADNFSVICTIENIDPMGVHTGDSITVAPAMTLTDKEYQVLRDAARAVMTEVGVQTGGSNVQFAVNPQDGEVVVIEMNPRVSRSSALASKATGYPIAKIAAKLAVGYRLDELRNDITGTSAAFEPTIDYVVCKIPRFAFEKFAGADVRLTTQMKSVGEAMAIGRTFKQAFQKGLRSLELARPGFVSLLDRVDYQALAERVRKTIDGADFAGAPRLRPGTRNEEDTSLVEAILTALRVPSADRIWMVGDAFRTGATLEQVFEATHIDRWFLAEFESIIQEENGLKSGAMPAPDAMRELKTQGWSDAALAQAIGVSEATVRQERRSHGVEPIFCQVDSCAAEFPALTPYLYSTWGDHSDAPPSDRKKVMILGGGPNRIGQGIEFDYCCVHAVFALKELGFETVMVNCNPETVSTDYDTADRLYFEPLTFEDVMAVADREKPVGVILQFGGQTPLKLAVSLAAAGIAVMGTSAEAIDQAEDREKFDALLTKLDLKRPMGAIARGAEEALKVAERLSYPLVVRPSYVLGGRAMEIVHSASELGRYFRVALEAVEDAQSQTILLDCFLNHAIEYDVDCLCDGKQAVIGGILQHVEQAGVHSGDSTMVLPPYSTSAEVLSRLRQATRDLALELGVVGLMNVQFAVQDDEVYVIEVNPRASRTVPFISKATGVPLAKLAAKVMAGKSLEELGYTQEITLEHTAVKESVFPFAKFPGVDTILGPEMRSTGEVMGLDTNFPLAFYKALLAAGNKLPRSGVVFMSVRDADKPMAVEVAQGLRKAGFSILATQGTAAALQDAGVDAEVVLKVRQGRPHIVDRLRSGDVAMVINTTEGAKAIADSYSMRRQTLMSAVPYFTTIAAGKAVTEALLAHREGPLSVRALQDYTLAQI